MQKTSARSLFNKNEPSYMCKLNEKIINWQRNFKIRLPPTEVE